MSRVTPAEEKPVTVISAKDFEEDLARGYCVLEYNPERTEILRDPRSNRTVERKLPADLLLRCMHCQFDTLDGNVSVRGGEVLTGATIMREHQFHAGHNWPYNVFSNPYGNSADVVIEGVTDYPAHLAAAKEVA